MPALRRGQLRPISRDPRIRLRPPRCNDERFPKSVGMGPVARKERETHSKVSTAFDTCELQSNIRSFRLSSKTSLGIDCRRAADFDTELLQEVRLRTADEVFIVRGKSEGRRRNLVYRRKDFQKEEGTPGRLTRLTSESRPAELAPMDDEMAGGSCTLDGLRSESVLRDWIPRRPAAKRFE